MTLLLAILPHAMLLAMAPAFLPQATLLDMVQA